MQLVVSLLVVCVAASIGLSRAAPVDLQAKYPFSLVLLDSRGQYYGLHWNFTRSTEAIYFAVNVSTTGWVGFGLSPNGQMPGSDVVMGWVVDGQSYFQDRYAESRSLPVIDAVSQDWFLTNSQEENGFTLLEFSRNFTSCDPQDLDITGSTARVVWSYSVSDPTNPSGSDARRHDYMGSRIVNLIGGTPSVNSATLESENVLDFTVTNVTIPGDSTTYWCETFRVPQQFSERLHYINRFGPSLTNHPRAYVHHIIVYECPRLLAEESIGLSKPCDNFSLADSCRTGLTIGGWAVGGEDFVFPEGIAFPIGGSREAMIELHYDNPEMTNGVIDNSGMRFYYTTEAPRHMAGSIALGHEVTPYMLVPPGSRNYTITGICTTECTRNLPSEGIRVFSNFFHTHLAGRGLTIQHFRYNTECNVLEELEPIDQNLRYDFNYQQTVILPREHLVLPGDILVLKCFYNTMDRNSVIIGGESTRDEMCESYINYYPRPADLSVLELCQSTVNPDVAFNQFYTTLLNIDPAIAETFADEMAEDEQVLSALNSLDWANNPMLATSLEESVTNTTSPVLCYSTESGLLEVPPARPVVPGCSYQAPNRCGGPAAQSCCQQVGSGAVCVHASATALLMLMVAMMML